MRLVEPLTLAGRSITNRVLFGPHVTNLGDDRTFSTRHVAYYRRRAAGGCGLIVTETASVHDSDWPYERCPDGHTCDAGWSAVAEAVHAEGRHVVAGLGHTGLQGSSAYHQRELWAPSAVPDAATREVPKVMEADDIRAVIDGFGRAAARAIDAGMDGVEINAGQHSLVRQFLSGLTNTRGDEWDGDRLRFAQAVLSSVRSAAPEAIVGLRLSCDELAPWAGITPQSAAPIAAALAPSVDYLVVVRGSIFSASATAPDSHTPPGFTIDLAASIHEAVAGACAVYVQGSIVDPAMAEAALERGLDGVEMTRAQIADPDLVARLGSPERIRPCILCNQRCQVRDARNPVVSCVVNPDAGHEADEIPAPPVPSRRVHVIGGGPAGLEAARVAAEAGHEVTVFERDEPGATVRAWARASGREPAASFIDWLVAECTALGVEIVAGVDVTAQEIKAWTDIVVIEATGSGPGRQEFEVNGGRVLEALEALDTIEPRDGDAVVVWDPIGGPIGVSIAETLAPHHDTTLVTPDVIAGSQLTLTGDLAPAGTRLQQAGVTLVKHHVLQSVDHGAAVLRDRVTSDTVALPAGWVVIAGHRLPAPPLAPGHTIPIGDTVAPRSLYEAVLEGRRAARDIS